MPADRRQARPAPGRWSVAENIEHLAIVERRVAGRLAGGLETARANPGRRIDAALAIVVDAAEIERARNRTSRSRRPRPPSRKAR